MDFECAKALANMAFNARHPIEMQPSWLKSAVAVSGKKDKDKNWIIHYSVVPFAPLEKNQMWEIIDGSKVVVEIDENTGEKMVLISRAGPPPLILFEAVIDKDTRLANVIIDADLSNFNASQFECYEY